MTVENEIVVHYKDGFAEADVGGSTIQVATNDDPNRKTLCPVELISAALGTWIVLTITAVAENKRIALDDVRVKVIRVSDEPDVGQTSFNLSIELIGLLSQRETILLYNSARNCEVHKLMTGKMEFNYYLLHEEE